MFDSLRQLVTQLLSLLQMRIELLTTELSGELRRPDASTLVCVGTIVGRRDHHDEA